MTVCYNTKTAIQTVWSSGGSSDSVVIEWWTSLCDAKTGACVQWLDCSHEVSGFSGLCQSPVSASDKKSTLRAHQMAPPGPSHKSSCRAHSRLRSTSVSVMNSVRGQELWCMEMDAPESIRSIVFQVRFRRFKKSMSTTLRVAHFRWRLFSLPLRVTPQFVHGRGGSLHSRIAGWA